MTENTSGIMWYLFCENTPSHEHEAVSSALKELKRASHLIYLVCTDGVARNMYPVPDHNFAKRFYHAQSNLAATFKIFRTEEGKTGEWKPEESSKLTVHTLIKRRNLLNARRGGTIRKSATRFR